MWKKTKNNLLNKKIGDYAYICDKEGDSLTGEVLNWPFNNWKDVYATSISTEATITTADCTPDSTIGGGSSGSWVYPYYSTPTTATTTASTVTIPPFYIKDIFEDENESFYIVCDTFEEGEDLFPKRKFTEGVKEVCFSMVVAPSKQMEKNGTTFPVYFYTPKKRIKEGEKIPSGNYFCHNNILWKKCYGKEMAHDKFFKFVETYFY